VSTSHRVLAGIGLVVATTLCFTVLDTTTKIVAASAPLLTALWVRSVGQAVLTTIVVLPVRGMGGLRAVQPGVVCLRGALFVVTNMLAFLSLRHMAVAEFSAIAMMAPLVMTLLAAWFLRERVSPMRWALVAGGFCGALAIIRPGGAAFNWAALLPLGVVASNAAFQVLTSRLARTENPYTMHLYTGWVAAALTSLAVLFDWAPITDPQLLASLGLIALAATVGHFFLILAYQRAPVATLAPFLYLHIAFAMVGGWLVFSHVPDALSVAGIAAIVVCGAASGWLTVRDSRAAARGRIA